ncbi:MAG: Gfo/Idh/MocA family protein [Gemmatimonadota bacterium]
MTDRKISRRAFVGDVALAGMAATVAPRGVLGRRRRASRDKLNVACIGVGGMGANDVDGVGDENVVALCDVDWSRAEETFAKYPKATRYRDFREMLETEGANIDAVTISTPDHTHGVAALMALRMGKHVYCQKPLARTIHEVREIAREAERAGVVTQMGNQGHASDETRRIREWVEAGAIGTVRRVEYWTNRPIWPQGTDRPTEAHHVPPELSWDLWLGPMPERPYHPAYAPFSWRGWWDFGTGALGDMACHIMDAAYWALDLGYPTRISPESSQPYPETAPDASRVEFDFPARSGRPALTVVWRDGGLVPPRPADWPEEERWPPGGSGQLWIGDDGTLVAGTYANNPRLSDPERHERLMADPPEERYPRTDGVYDEWLTACREGEKAGSDFVDYAAPFTEMVLLGNLAVRMGRTLELDPATGQVTNVEVPEEYFRPPGRDGWSV